jgi:hypothetical protein
LIPQKDNKTSTTPNHHLEQDAFFDDGIDWDAVEDLPIAQTMNLKRGSTENPYVSKVFNKKTKKT